MKIPCEECITYALCKQKNPLSCELLNKYLYGHGWNSETHYDRMNQIKKIFNRNAWYRYDGNGKELTIEWIGR